jgi:hypothetical protein
MTINNELRSHAGPPLLLPALAYTFLFAASLIASGILRHGAAFVGPNGSTEAVQRFFAQSPEADRVYAFLFLGSAIPLGVYTATVVSRLRFLGVRAAGTYIALFGGFAASGMLAACALCSWVLSVPEVNASAPVTRALYVLSFLFGGTAFAAGFGLLAAGVSLTSYFARLLPQWLMWFGMVVAVAGVLSTFSLIASPMEYAIPITRFGGILWLIAVAVMLPKRVADAN